jgi:chromosome segregation ATPase
MSKQHKGAARHGYDRQAIRQALDEVPVDLVDNSENTANAGYQLPQLHEDPADQQARQRRGWFGLARRENAAKGVTAPSAVQHQALLIEVRAQRLEEALAVARDDLGAATHELRDAHQRITQLDAEVAAERTRTTEWHDTAAELNQHLDDLREQYEQLQHERAALGSAYESEQRGRQHWEHVASEQMAALDQLGEQLTVVTADLGTERAAHEQTKAYAAEAQQQLTSLHAQWEAHAEELTDVLTRERDEYHHTLEDERHTAEQARAEQAFQHREQLETVQQEASTAIAALQRKLADATAALEHVRGDLGATQADVVRLTDDLVAIRGEALAANARARDADELRLRAEQRTEELGEELAYVRTEVMGAAGGKKGVRKPMFGRGKPATIKAAERPNRPAVVNFDVPAPPTDPDVDDIIERRLFGSA